MDDTLNLKDALNAFEQLKSLTAESVAQSLAPVSTANAVSTSDLEALPTEVTPTQTAAPVAAAPVSAPKVPTAFQNTSIRDPKLIEALVEFHSKHNPKRGSRTIIPASEAAAQTPSEKSTETTASSEFKSTQGPQHKASFNPVEIPVVEASPKPTSPMLSRMVRTTRPILR